MNFIAETERWRFRAFQLGEEDGVYEFSSDPEAQKCTGNKNTVSKDEAKS